MVSKSVKSKYRRQAVLAEKIRAAHSRLCAESLVKDEVIDDWKAVWTGMRTEIANKIGVPCDGQFHASFNKSGVAERSFIHAAFDPVEM